jgi:hypothetical protein
VAKRQRKRKGKGGREDVQSNMLESKISLLPKVVWSVCLLDEDNVFNSDSVLSVFVIPRLVGHGHTRLESGVVENYGRHCQSSF